MRKPILALAALFLALVIAVPAVVAPLFPVTLPASTVWGRLGIGPGPGQAIPFSVLFGNLFNGGSAPTAHGVLIGEGTSPLNSVVCPTGQILIPVTGADPVCGVLPNASLATAPNNTVKGNVSGVTATPTDLTPGQVGGMLCVPQRSVFISGTAATYTTPTCNGVTATWLEVELQGGGSSGGGSGTSATSPTAGNPGNASSFGALTANGGATPSVGNSPAAGGACSGSLGTQQNFPGSGGQSYFDLQGSLIPGPNGGSSFYGGAGVGQNGGVGGNAIANSGSGGAGGGGSSTSTVVTGGAGAAGCHISTVIISPAPTYAYTIGATATGGSAGTSGSAGGQGAAGLLMVTAHWQ